MFPVTDADLERARTDPQFRHDLLTQGLETLLAALKRAQSGDAGPDAARRMKEGAALAVQLANKLHRLGIVPSQAA